MVYVVHIQLLFQNMFYSGADSDGSGHPPPPNKNQVWIQTGRIAPTHPAYTFPPTNDKWSSVFESLTIFFLNHHLHPFISNTWVLTTGLSPRSVTVDHPGSLTPRLQNPVCIHACFNVASKLNISAPVFLTLEMFLS